MQPATMGGVRMACEKLEQTYTEVLGKSKIAALPFYAISKAG